MIRPFFCATAVVCLCAANLAAQTIRFDTNVGTFDMELNPTGNPFLQGHVDNMIAYVESGRYDVSVINRAATGFVLQMGGFQAPFLSLPASFNAFPNIPTDSPVIVDTNGNNSVSFDTTGLTNSLGTVTLALSSNNQNIPRVSSGTSSFFINLGNNTNLDVGQTRGGFIPFARIENMETVNLIMALPQANLDPSGQNLAAINVPILEDNHLVIIERAFVLGATEEQITASVANATIFDEPSSGELSSIVSDDPPLDDPGGLLTVAGVPEPSTMLLASAMAMLAVTRRRLH